MKTLRVTLSDIVGPTGTPNSTATVHARYVDPSGRGRDVHLTDGTIVVPVRRTVAPGTAPQHFDFDVYANDVAPVREVDYGHLVEVSWTVVAPTGAKTSGVRRVAITDDTPGVVQLGLLSTPTPVPPYTGGYSLPGHKHDVGGITATGTPSASTYLRGDGSWATPASGGGGGGGTSPSTVTADDTPAAPAEGESATYFVTSAVVWPLDLVWSTDPDGGIEPTITDAALVSMFTLDGTTYAVLGSTFPVIVTPDVTAPTAGTLSVTAFASTTINVSVAGASDETALHATPYAFSSDNGATYSAYQSGATYGFTGLTASTSYTLRHRVRDAAGNVTVGTAVVQATDAAPADSTPPTVGTLAGSAITTSGFTLTVTGASDNIGGSGLHATPYRFSTDDGAAYSAWQSSAVYAATGLAASTGYTCKHQTRDAAGNVSTGASVLVTTGSGATVLASDDFNRADGELGSTPVGGLAWAHYTANNRFTIVSNQAKVATSSGNGLSFVNVGQADQKVTVKVATSSIASGAALRVTSDGTSAGTSFYRVAHLSGSFYIVKHPQFGTATILETWAGSLTSSDTLTAQAVTNGANVDFTVYKNGVSIRTYSDTTGALTGTRAGLFGIANAILDGFVVEAP